MPQDGFILAIGNSYSQFCQIVTMVSTIFIRIYETI